MSLQIEVDLLLVVCNQTDYQTLYSPEESPKIVPLQKQEQAQSGHANPDCRAQSNDLEIEVELAAEEEKKNVLYKAHNEYQLVL